jgi:hypothetical protein
VADGREGGWFLWNIRVPPPEIIVSSRKEQQSRENKKNSPLGGKSLSHGIEKFIHLKIRPHEEREREKERKRKAAL